MKRFKLIGLALVLGCLGVAAFAATYSVVELKSATAQNLAGVDVGLCKYLNVSGALPATTTVTVSRISGVVTTAVAAVVCTGGNGAGAATANMYLIAGDKLIRSGASNTPTVRLIIEE
jgi:hypothetical protein